MRKLVSGAEISVDAMHMSEIVFKGEWMASRLKRREFLIAIANGMMATSVFGPRLAQAQALPQTPTTVVDGRKISVEAVESVRGMTPSIQFDMSKAMANPAMQFQNGKMIQQPGGGGGGVAKASGGGIGLSGSLASYGIALSVAAPGNNARAVGKAADVILEIAPEVKAVDDNGEALESPPIPFAAIHFVEFERRNPGKQFVYLRASKEVRTSLKTLDGELVVTPGRNVVVEFPAPINGKVTKKAFEESFAVESLQAGPDSIRVVALFPAPKNQAIPMNMQQFMQMSMVPNEKNSCLVEIVDDQGDVHYPSSGGSSGGTQMSTFSFGGTTGQPGKPVRQRQAAPVPTSRAFDFQPLPAGRSVKAVRLRWIERTGASRRVPFQLRDIPVSG